MASDQRIRDKIKLLQAVANDHRAPQGEREAAKGRIAALKEKLPKVDKVQATNEELLRMAAAFQRMGTSSQQATRMHQRIWPPQQAPEWLRVQQEAELLRKMQRDAAQRAWEERNKSRDPMGRPQTAQDMFDEALRRDGRTHEQKQADMNNRNRRPADVGPRCAALGQAESFYDQGGEPRKRNGYVAACDRCHNLVQPGDGCLFKVAGLWITRCCETVPGPRPKKSRRS